MRYRDSATLALRSFTKDARVYDKMENLYLKMQFYQEYVIKNDKNYIMYIKYSFFKVNDSLNEKQFKVNFSSVCYEIYCVVTIMMGL